MLSKKIVRFLKCGFLIISIGFLMGISGCKEDAESDGTFTKQMEEDKGSWKKGYDLPIDEAERKEAEKECIMILKLISDIYAQADKGDALNTVLDDKTIYKMQDRIKEKGYPVTTIKAYAVMENYKKVEDFLKNCQEKKSGDIQIQVGFVMNSVFQNIQRLRKW